MFTSLSFLSLYVCVFVCVLACVCAFVHACPLLSHEMIIPFIDLMLQENRVSHCGSCPCRSTGGTLFRRPFHQAGCARHRLPGDQRKTLTHTHSHTHTQTHTDTHIHTPTCLAVSLSLSVSAAVCVA